MSSSLLNLTPEEQKILAEYAQKANNMSNDPVLYSGKKRRSSKKNKKSKRKSIKRKTSKRKVRKSRKTSRKVRKVRK